MVEGLQTCVCGAFDSRRRGKISLLCCISLQTGWTVVQQLCGRVMATLPGESADHVVRAAVRLAAAAIVELLASDSGVREYNLYAMFRLHGDVAGLQQWADTLTQVPRLRVRPLLPSFPTAQSCLSCRTFTSTRRLNSRWC